MKNKQTLQIKPATFPVLRFILLSIAFISLLVFFSSLGFIQDFLIRFTAISLHGMLNALSIPVELVEPHVLQLSEGTRLRFSIVPDCTGIYPIAILTGIILAYPARKTKKFLGIVGAVFSSLIVNFLRMISLMAIAVSSFRAFEIAHLLIWQTSFVLLVVGYFLWWIRWK